ncbi:SDR family oxidoreductase [Actinoplanes sp. KI2]|uniref:SDR family oxidoreductase n=1 Tax=Actinoplanes sp. KI2 TaxID=2983315 RepID=UPI0021D5B96A|nr:SDR family oxidoreductase [Actinoplanes sp. KI2]MCU7729670.1 SDR family oxidoreductase [Actinoplanes sp. KI2]
MQFLDIAEKKWQATFDLNCHALVRMSRAALPSLLHNGGSQGVRSNAILPGPTRTRLWDAPGGFADQLAVQFSLPEWSVDGGALRQL